MCTWLCCCEEKKWNEMTRQNAMMRVLFFLHFFFVGGQSSSSSSCAHITRQYICGKCSWCYFNSQRNSIIIVFNITLLFFFWINLSFYSHGCSFSLSLSLYVCSISLILCFSHWIENPLQKKCVCGECARKPFIEPLK